MNGVRGKVDMTKVLEIGRGHSLNDSPTIEVENEDGTKTTTLREYPIQEREETSAESRQRAIDHAALSEVAYRWQRQAAYPATGDGLDAFYHYLTSLTPEAIGALPQPTKDWFQKCQATKEAIPKE